jgi:hypothetical protein
LFSLPVLAQTFNTQLNIGLLNALPQRDND